MEVLKFFDSTSSLSNAKIQSYVAKSAARLRKGPKPQKEACLITTLGYFLAIESVLSSDPVSNINTSLKSFRDSNVLEMVLELFLVKIVTVIICDRITKKNNKNNRLLRINFYILDIEANYEAV